MQNNSGTVLLKAPDTTLSKAEVNEMHNHSGIAQLVGLKGHFE